MHSKTDLDIIEEVIVKDDVQEVRTRSLIIYNDDFNQLDFVIESLINVCKHDLIQAEQCTMIIHYNGKCAL